MEKMQIFANGHEKRLELILRMNEPLLRSYVIKTQHNITPC